MLSPQALLRRLVGWLAGSSSGKRREGDDLSLTRLSYSKSWLVKVDEELGFKPRAFMPYRPEGCDLTRRPPDMARPRRPGPRLRGSSARCLRWPLRGRPPELAPDPQWPGTVLN